MICQTRCTATDGPSGDYFNDMLPLPPMMAGPSQPTSSTESLPCLSPQSVLLNSSVGDFPRLLRPASPCHLPSLSRCATPSLGIPATMGLTIPAVLASPQPTLSLLNSMSPMRRGSPRLALSTASEESKSAAANFEREESAASHSSAPLISLCRHPSKRD